MANRKLSSVSSSRRLDTIYWENEPVFYYQQDLWRAKKAILLSSGGAKTYSLLRNIVASAKLSDKSCNRLVRILNEHQNPKSSVIMERYINSTKETNNQVRAFLFMLLNLSICQNIVILGWLWEIWLGADWFVVWGVRKFSNVC